jgi:hypothetical protein
MHVASVNTRVFFVEEPGNVGETTTLLRTQIVLAVEHRVTRHDGRQLGEKSLSERREPVEFVETTHEARDRVQVRPP